MSYECSCVPGHRMTEPEGRCADCGLTEMEVEELGRDNLPPCLPNPDEITGWEAMVLAAAFLVLLFALVPR